MLYARRKGWQLEGVEAEVSHVEGMASTACAATSAGWRPRPGRARTPARNRQQVPRAPDPVRPLRGHLAIDRLSRQTRQADASTREANTRAHSRVAVSSQ